MRFDWRKFVVERGIPFVSSGRNVARNNIGIRCPLCAANDPSEHMGLSLDQFKPYWHCWRDSQHSGKNPAFLVMALLGCSILQARQIVNQQQEVYVDQLDEVIAQLSGQRKRKARDKGEETAAVGIRFPREIKPIDGHGYSRGFIDYLVGRGFYEPYRTIELADLHYSVTGEYQWRVIFPVYLNQYLVAWTGRDITGRASLRYKSLPIEQSALPLKACLYEEDRVIVGGQVLFVTEGPMDALKMLSYLQPASMATCLFGMPSQAQVTKLLLYAAAWQHIVILLDPDVLAQTLQLWALLAKVTDVRTMHLPAEFGDPGRLWPAQIRKIERNYCNLT